MAKPSKKRASLMGNYRRVGTLAVVGVIALGGAYAASAGDLIYASRSLLAAVIAPIDSTPRLVISRNASTPIWSVWPGTEKTFAIFDVAPKYLQYYGYVRTFAGSVHVNSKTAGLSVGKIGVRYEACETSGYCVAAQVPISSPVASSSIIGKAYFFNATLAPNLVGPNKTGKIIITGIPYYDTIYSTSGTTASVKAQIDYAAGAGQVVSTASTTSTVYRSVPVYTNLAYGNWIKVTRGSGYAYGYWDINNNGALAASDANILANIAVGTQKCPLFKLCDINKSGSVTVTDSSLLLKYAVGSLPPPSSATASVSLVSTATTVDAGDLANDDRGTFKIRYKVTAIGGDVYVPSQVSSIGASTTFPTGQVVVAVARGDSKVGGSGVATTLTSLNNLTKTAKGNYRIASGASETFEVVTAVQLPSVGKAGLYRAWIANIFWSTADLSPLDRAYMAGVEALRTAYLSLD